MLMQSAFKSRMTDREPYLQLQCVFLKTFLRETISDYSSLATGFAEKRNNLGTTRFVVLHVKRSSAYQLNGLLKVKNINSCPLTFFRVNSSTKGWLAWRFTHRALPQRPKPVQQLAEPRAQAVAMGRRLVLTFTCRVLLILLRLQFCAHVLYYIVLELSEVDCNRQKAVVAILSSAERNPFQVGYIHELRAYTCFLESQSQ